MADQELLIEHFPDRVLALIESRDREERNALPQYINNFSLELVFEDIKLWRTGSLTVSFKGGNEKLHREIAQIASAWSKFGNITFDFFDENGETRKWHPLDESHIRVGFNFRGYWSLVGTDSRDPRIVDPGDITLNLGGFDDGRAIDDNRTGTILHEFGHALGFKHEHQTQALECDFNWPVVYKTLAGSPNFWPKNKVDHNLRQLTEGGLQFSAHDNQSIMHYAFPSWMFLQGGNSPCFTTLNNDLSDTDKNMMGRAYPADQSLDRGLIDTRAANLENILSTGKGISDQGKLFHQTHLEFLTHGS